MRDTINIVPSHFRKYIGYRPPVPDPVQRAQQMAFSLITECLAGPRTPFRRIADNCLYLCDETADYLYKGDYGFNSEPYRPGMYPLLEKWAARYVKSDMSQGEAAVALSQSLYHDLPDAYPKVPVFLYGESDEQTLLKGGGHCSCKARLLTALCQIVGMEARPVLMYVWTDPSRDPEKILGGHTVTEIYIDGQWGFFDPQHHLYCQARDGRFPGLWQIRQQPELLTDMDEDVVRKMEIVGYRDAPAGMSDFEYYWYKNISPACPICISRHEVMDQGEVKWMWATDEFRARQNADFAQHRALLTDLARRGELTEEIYQLRLDAFREKFGITSGQLASCGV